VFVTSLYSCCSLDTLYCCYFIIPLILLTFLRYVPYYHYLHNVVTSLSPYCCVLISLYLASHYSYVGTPLVVLFFMSHLILCFSSVPLFLSALSLRRYACVLHFTIVCLHMTLCTVCMSLYLVPRCDVLEALLYSTSLNHVLNWLCVILSGTELLLTRHIWLYFSHVVKHHIVHLLYFRLPRILLLLCHSRLCHSIFTSSYPVI